MIDRIVIENFKSLRRVDLKLGRVNLLVGANGSGKSNVIDALRVLQGIGNGFTISEIFDGKPKDATNAKWEGIRGGSRYAAFRGPGGGGVGGMRFQMHGRFAGGPFSKWVGADKRTADGEPALHWDLLVEVEDALAYVTRECFTVDAVVYDTDDAARGSPNDSPQACPLRAAEGWTVPWDWERPLLGQLARGPWERGLGTAGSAGDLRTLGKSDAARAVCADHARGVAEVLANVRRVEPELRFLHDYARVGKARNLGDQGENFAAVVQAICDNETDKDVYLSWLRELRPEQVDDVGVLRGAVGEPMFMLRENGRELPAPVLSAGTLRFAAVAAAFFQPDMPSVMALEEIENGVHASRLRMLLELLRIQAEETDTQIVATTHSPTVLDWLEERDYETTFLCKRDEETGESRIRALSEVPQFLDVVKKTPASELFTEGWLEAAR